MRFFFEIALFLFFLFSAFNTEAAVLYFEKNSDVFYYGDIFLLTLKINTEKERINAAQITIKFPQDKLKVVDLVKEESIFSLWPKEPSFSNEIGTISLVGGVPRGFEGKGKILSIAFKVVSENIKENKVEIDFGSDCLVLLNDGLGTKTNLKIQKEVFLVYSFPSNSPKNELQELLNKDNVPPEPFSIFFIKSHLISPEKYFIAFFALDFQSGIDYYQIWVNNEWKKVKSNFYLIENQNLKGEIKVKAIDKAGNERISILKLD